MASQPAEADIEMLCSFGISRDEAIRRLKGNNNDLNQAANEYYDNPDSMAYSGWVDAHFTSARDGSSNNGSSFQVHGLDDHNGGSYPATRPPSRTENSSPTNNRVVSLAAEHAAADPRATGRVSDEDYEFHQALEASRRDAGLSPQQYGTTESDSTPYFGPANRPEYQRGEWDLVLMPKPNGQEVFSDPEAIDRKRESGAPAFLRPSVTQHRLPSLLTIYHEIPLAREIFLARGDVLCDYGFEKRWWEGAEIKRVDLSAEDDDVDMLESADKGKVLIHELQRLMAFLDDTDRSYGSAEALCGMLGHRHASHLEAIFFSTWKRLCREEAAMSSIFSIAKQPEPQSVIQSSDPKESGDDPITEGGQTTDFAILDLLLPERGTDLGPETLYDLADDTLWGISSMNVAESAYMSHVGDVISFRLQGTPTSPLVIPLVWYPDRYLKTGREAALEMRLRKAHVQDQIITITKLEEKLCNYTTPRGGVAKVKDLLETCLAHDVVPIVDEMVNSGEEPEDDIDMASESRACDRMDISLKLRKLMASIDRKLIMLNEEKEKAQQSLRELSTLYTELSTDSENPPKHKYSLRGVSATKNITYVRRKAEPDLIDMSLDATDASAEDQWWRITFTASAPDHRPVVMKKIPHTDVLEAISKDSQSPILVYASEAAMAEPFQPLPDALKSFVRADNLSFDSEFVTPEDLRDSHEQSQITSPKSPGKRKYGESQDSQDAAPQRYVDSNPKWDGLSPPREKDDISKNHAGPTDSSYIHSDLGRGESQQHLNFNAFQPPRAEELRECENSDIIMGLDPSDIIDAPIPDVNVDMQKALVSDMHGAKARAYTTMLEPKGNIPALMPSLMGGSDEPKSMRKGEDGGI